MRACERGAGAAVRACSADAEARAAASVPGFAEPLLVDVGVEFDEEEEGGGTGGRGAG